MPGINLCRALSTEPVSSPENAGCCFEDTSLGGSHLILGEPSGAGAWQPGGRTMAS